MSTKVLVIGWDSAEKDLLLQWSESGELPTIQKLRNKGQWGILSSPLGMADEAIWATFYTGVSPAKHGRFFGKQICPGSYDLIRFKDSHLKHEPFWEGLSRAKKKVAILDVPKCPLSSELNGIQLVDWMVHGPEHRQVCSWPPSLASDIVAKVGKQPKSLCGYRVTSSSELEELLPRLHKGIALKTDLYLSLLEQDNWDLFLGVFKSSHCVGHMFWHLWDSSHPSYREDLVKKLGNPIKLMYQALDNSLNRILDRVSDDTTVILFSDLGMGANHSGNQLLPEVLRRLDRFPTNSGKASLGWFRQKWKQIPATIRNPLSRKLVTVNKRVSNFEESLSRFFVVPHNEASGAIRVNLKGREPNGCIHPGKEYDQLCDSLSHALMQLVCPQTGKPLVNTVIRLQDRYEGPYQDNLPDLLVIWNRFQPISQAFSPQVGTIKVQDLDLRPGNHIDDGILFASGPGIPNGSHFERASLMDLTATISAKLGVSLPDIDGMPIPELMKK
jgi:predicted AlkP superfamily phosphohydrolase/phosphomutase